MTRAMKELAAKVRTKIESETGQVWTGSHRAWERHFMATYCNACLERNRLARVEDCPEVFGGSAYEDIPA